MNRTSSPAVVKATDATAPVSERAAAAEAQRISAARRRYTLLLLILVYIVAMMDRSIVTVLLQPIKLEFALNDTQLGFVSGLAFAIAFSIAALPLGHLVDRVQRRWILAVVVVIWSGLTFSSGFATAFVVLCVARLGVGFAEAGEAPSAMSLVADLYPANKRASAVALLYLGVPIGAILGLLIAGYVVPHLGWRAALMVAGTPGILLAVVIALTMKEPVRGSFDAAPASAAQSLSLGQGIRGLIHDPVLVHLLVGTGLLSMVASSMSVWMPTLLMRHFDLPIAHVGRLLALSTGICGIIGSVVCGPLADRLTGGKASRLAFATAVFGLLMGLVWAACISSSDHVRALIFNGIFNALVPGYLACVHGAVLTHVAPRTRGFTVGVVAIMTNLVGYGVGPQLVGIASDLLTARGSDAPLAGAMMLMLVPAVWGSLHYFAAARRKAAQELR